MYSYPIDYELFTQEEIVSLIEFFSMIEDINEKKKIDAKIVLKKYKEYRLIINSMSLEKQIDRDFLKVSGYSIYKTINNLK